MNPDIETLLSHTDWLRGLARGMADEPGLADDAAQDALVAALERAPGAGVRLRGWLRVVTRNVIAKALRTERRRQDRERAVAHTGTAPSTLEVVERFSTQHAVAAAVLRLTEPFRQTILLRYYEDLSLREIADRTGVAVSTVEDRLRRGTRDLLRTLRRELGDDEAWLTVVLLGRKPAPEIAPAGSATVLLGLSLAVALFACIGMAVLVVRGVAPARLDDPSRVAVAPSAQPRQAPSQGLLGDVGSSFRRDTVESAPLAALPAPTAPGSLHVRLEWEDGRAAHGVPVELWPEALGGRYSGPIRSSVSGSAVFAQLPPGDYRIVHPLAQSRRVRVRAADNQAASLTLPRGARIEGVVVDAQGAPVPFAHVWVSASPPEELAAGRPVPSVVSAAHFLARADAAGRFELESAGGAITLGAIAQGRAPSLAHHVAHDVDQQRLRVVLRGPAGSLSGRALDPEGAPVGGASIYLDAAGDSDVVVEGVRIRRVAPRFLAITDDQGRFAFASTRAGSRDLLARAAGFEAWNRSVEVSEHGPTTLEIRFERGIDVRGHVSDAEGDPLAGVVVYGTKRRWPAMPDLRHSSSTRTDIDGSFELGGLPPGSCWLTAEGEERGRQSLALLAERGTTQSVELVLQRGELIAGRVVDEEGRGIGGCEVLAVRVGDWRPIGARTDANGAFSIHGCEDDSYDVSVHEAGVPVHRQRMRAGLEDVELSIASSARPSACLSGRLVDPEGRPVRASGLRLVEDTTGRGFTLGVSALANGSFRSSGITPGDYRVSIRARGYPALELEAPASLRANDSVDLGVVSLPSGAPVELHPIAPEPLYRFFARIRDASGRVVKSYHFPDADPYLPLSLVLAQGSYSVTAWASGIVPVHVDFEVRGGESQRIALMLEAGATQRFRFRQSQSGAVRNVRLGVRDGDGRRLFEDDLELISGAGFLALAPGRYEYEAETPQGCRCSGSFSIDESPLPPAPIDCPLK